MPRVLPEFRLILAAAAEFIMPKRKDKVGLDREEYEWLACESNFQYRKDKAQVMMTRALSVTGCGSE
jgi:hypothetical protein